MKLYEIKNRMIEVLLDSTEDENDLSDAFLQRINELEIDFEEKAVNVAAHIKNMEADLEAFANYLEKMKKKKKAIENKIESLKKYLTRNLQELKYTKIESPAFNITLGASHRVVLDPIKHLPDEYMISRIEYIPNKVLIGLDLEQGKEIEGAYLETNHFIKIN